MPLTVKSSKTRIDIFRAKEETPILTVNAPPDGRPFIHPWLAPDGVGSITENKPAHHPWQHGLYTGLNDVNGIGFWTEGLTGNPMDGTIHVAELSLSKCSGDNVSWQVESHWHAPDGQLILVEYQDWSLHDRGSTMLLGLDWNLRAAVDIRFGQSSYGGPFLRMPWRKETGGELLTSEGATTYQAADGKQARWVAVSMPLPNRQSSAGVAFLADNRIFPFWRVDGELGIGPSRSIPAEWHLEKGWFMEHCCSLFAFIGPMDIEAIEVAWKNQNFALPSK